MKVELQDGIGALILKKSKISLSLSLSLSLSVSLTQ
jgi:hypothetical protein